jgi:hypothetical protein
MDYWDMADESDGDRLMRQYPWFHATVFALVGLIAAGVGGFFSTDLWRGLRTQRWAPTPCVIEKAKIDWFQARTGTHFVTVRYRYEVNGQSRIGTRFRGTGNDTKKRENLTQYVANQAATCFINPANPAEAVLRQDIDGDECFISALMGFFALFFFGAAIRALRRRSEKAEEEEVASPALTAE